MIRRMGPLADSEAILGRMRLIQIPFSHNCIKVRVALRLKGLPYEVLDIPPMDRSTPRRVSGQGLVPVLEDGGRTLHDSTAILLYLEERYPDPSLLPSDPAARAECRILEDWADATFMAATRRIAYLRLSRSPSAIAAMFFPGARGLSAAIRGRVARRVLRRHFGLDAARDPKDVAAVRRGAALALARLADRPYLFGDRATIADVALATMSAPLLAAPDVASDPAVASLLAWGERLAGVETAVYRRSR